MAMGVSKIFLLYSSNCCCGLKHSILFRNSVEVIVKKWFYKKGVFNTLHFINFQQKFMSSRNFKIRPKNLQMIAQTFALGFAVQA